MRLHYHGRTYDVTPYGESLDLLPVPKPRRRRRRDDLAPALAAILLCVVGVTLLGIGAGLIIHWGSNHSETVGCYGVTACIAGLVGYAIGRRR